MDQKPQWDQLVPIPYVPDINDQITYLKSLLDSTDPRCEMQKANIKAAIVLYENGFDGLKEIYLIDGKQVDSLEAALLYKEPVWIEVGAMFVSMP